MNNLAQTGETIIFVDIDGPLLPFRMHYHPQNISIMKNPNRQHWVGDDLFKMKRQLVFDPVMVHAINKWTEAAEAKIVMSTAWAEQFSYEQMVEIFDRNGIWTDCIHDQWMTPRNPTWDRGSEISHWLFHNLGKIKNYLIIDDDISVLDAPGVRPDRVLLIDLNNGLRFDQLWTGCEILGLTQYDKVLM